MDMVNKFAQYADVLRETNDFNTKQVEELDLTNAYEAWERKHNKLLKRTLSTVQILDAMLTTVKDQEDRRHSGIELSN